MPSINVYLIDEEPCRIAHAIVPVGAEAEAFCVQANIAGPDAAIVARNFCCDELHLPVAVLGEVMVSERLPRQAVEVAAVLHIGGSLIFHALREQNPCAKLMEEVGRDGRDVAVAAEVDDQVGIPAAPSHPTFYVGGAAIQTISESRPCDGQIAGIGSPAGRSRRRARNALRSPTVALVLHEIHLRAQSQALPFLRHEAFAVEAAIVGRRIVALIERGHTIFRRPRLEEFQLLPDVGLRSGRSAGNLQFAVLQRQAREPHVLQSDSIVGHGLFSAVEEFVIYLDKLWAQHPVLVADGAVVDPKFLARSQQRALHHLEILVNPAVGSAVVVAQERPRQGIGVSIRIPHQFAEQIGPKLREVAAADAVHLREVHSRVVAGEELDVGLENVEVGERADDVVEVDAIVPDEDVVRDGAPSLQGTDEPLPRGIVRQRHLAFAVDVAEHDVDVRQRFGELRRLTGEQVSQRAELFVGVSLRQLVLEAYVGTAHGPSLFLVDFHALGAVAVGVVAIVLAHADKALARVGPEDAVELCAASLEDGRIAQAPLAVVARPALTVEEGVVFRMRLSKAAGRQNAVERVYPKVPDEGFVRFFKAKPILIDGVFAAIAVSLAIAESGRFCRFHLGERDARGRMLRHAVGRRHGAVDGVAFARQIVDAEMPFEQADDGIDGPSSAATPDVERAIIGSVQLKSVFSRPRRAASDDDVAASGLPFAAHLQRYARGAMCEVLQQCGGPQRRAVVVSADDACHGLAILRHHCLCGEMEGQKRERQQ